MELQSAVNEESSQNANTSISEHVENYSEDEIRRAVEVFQMLIKWRNEEAENGEVEESNRMGTDTSQ